MEKQERPILHNTRSKVITAFLMGCAAITLAFSITYFSFSELLDTVNKLSERNEKLQLLNNLFRHITSLDQQQRAAAITAPGNATKSFLEESQKLLLSIDSLRAIDWQNDLQYERLNEMEEILHKRNKLFLSYLKAKSDLTQNKKFTKDIDSLSDILITYTPKADSNVTTTEKKIITTTTHLPEQDGKAKERSFFGRLFSSKKSAPDTRETKIEVQEELNVTVDTLTVSRQDSAIVQIGSIVKKMEETQRLQSTRALQRELDLIRTNTALLSELLNILHEVENEEMNQLRSNNSSTIAFVNSSTKRITTIMVVFFLCAALLVYLILTDITKSQFYRKQLLQAKEEAEHLTLVKQRFLANMSHEIRTPLQSIIGFAELLRKQPKADTEALEAIGSSSEHLLHIVNEVLDYSRIESGKFVLEHIPFSMQSLLKEVESSIRIQAEKKELAFLIDSENVERVYLLGDPFRLRQILYNLLSNAVKFTHTGYVKLLVRAEDISDRMQFRFEVTDTGIGIHKEDMDRVFHNFEQANSSISQKYGGAGLGLSIVKMLVDAFHGTIHVASEPGNGSTFTVEMGFDKAPADAQEDEQKTALQPISQFNGKVLIVDNDPLILKLCGLILSGHSIDYVTCQFPEKLLTQKPDNDITHVFIDIRMPHVNGINLCAELKPVMNADTRFIAFTAHVLPHEREELLAKGFNHVLAKPFRDHELLKMLNISIEPEAHDNGSSHFDLSALHQMTMGDEKLLHSIIHQFIEDTCVDLETLEHEHDWPVKREIIHKLTGRTGQMGAHEISKKLHVIEKEIEKENTNDLLQNEINTVLHQVKSLLDELADRDKEATQFHTS